ncbi:hypothetical protein PWT90_00279 [Aphanocladium album]|nr:hypothetical protein PWT90_00279 [Aphanocladium album]
MTREADIVSLPVETKLHIVSYLSLWEKICLSATCKHFRALLAPDFLSKLKFSDDEGAAAALLAAESNGQYAIAIEAEVSAESADKMKTPALSPAAAELLGGRWTPNARTVRLNFDFTFEETHDWSEEGSDWFEGDEYDEDEGEAESKYLWRALVNETWQAVSANTAVDTLIVDGFLPIWQSAYKTPDFARFMKQIKHIKFIIASDEFMDATWTIKPGFQWIMEKVGFHFFQHLTSIESLCIDGDSCVLGGERPDFTPLPLRDISLPALRSLTLRSCYVDSALTAFLSRHGRTLTHLVLDECFAADMWWSEEDDSWVESSWADFFDAIHQTAPALVHLAAGHDADGVLIQKWVRRRDDRLIRHHICKALRRNRARRHFCYVRIDDNTGRYYRMNADMNKTAFSDGRDWKAYKRLMKLVKQNEAKATDVYAAPAEYVPLELKPACEEDWESQSNRPSDDEENETPDEDEEFEFWE